MGVDCLTGDALTVLRGLPDALFQTCVTSPPYFGLRDYGMDGQIGLEPSPEAFVAKLVEVFREVRRCLRPDGTLWVNIGDSYAGSWSGNSLRPDGGTQREGGPGMQPLRDGRYPARGGATYGCKPKDLIGIPWLLAFALRADGWWLRRDIIWHKPNAMPESVRDRPTTAHEHLFLLSKAESYFYDADAISEGDTEGATRSSQPKAGRKRGLPPRHAAYDSSDQSGLDGVPRGGRRSSRSVWTIATEPFTARRIQGWEDDHDHYAVMPAELARRCICAGSRPGDRVLDPFGGAGTTGVVADRERRHATLIDIHPKNAALARARVFADAPLLVATA